jgi:drug/metabolite transporter (DMT)-like permease
VAAVVTRKTGGLDSPLTTMSYSAFTGLALLSLALPFGFAMPSGRELLLALGVGVFSTIGHGFIVLAYRQARASVVAPFSYVQLIASGLLSYLAFQAVPDRWTLVGAAVIAVSGLYIAHRERVRAREARTETARAR